MVKTQETMAIFHPSRMPVGLARRVPAAREIGGLAKQGLKPLPITNPVPLGRENQQTQNDPQYTLRTP